MSALVSPAGAFVALQVVDVPGAHSIPCSTQEQWIEARRTGIGGSDAAVVLGISPFKTPLQLWAEKLRLLDDDVEQTEPIRWGKLLEPVIAEEWGRENGHALVDLGRWTVLRSRSTPFMLATLDRVIFAGNGNGVLEAKNTNAFRIEEWEADEPPTIYAVQVQQQLAVTGYDWGVLVALVGGQKLRWFLIERNQRFINMLQEEEHDFWRLVQRRQQPPVDDSKMTEEALRRLYKTEVEEKTVDLGMSGLDWDREREEAIALIREGTRRKRLIDNLIRASMGDAEVGLLPDGGRFTWRTEHRREHIVPASANRVLRRSGAKDSEEE